MTADAKVGLLLGLFFIVLIAFLINGLPAFLQSAGPEDMVSTTSIVAPSGPDLVIDHRVTQTAQRMAPGVPLRAVEPPRDVIVLDSAPQAAAPIAVETPAVPAPAQPTAIAEHVEQIVLPPSSPSRPVRPAASTAREHVVQRGETLASIAQTYYGPEEGNRRAVVQQLYEANRDVLSSPDRVVVGNRLTIPPLNSAAASAASTEPSEGLLQRFSNFFERTPSQPRAAQPQPTSRTTEYVVQPGDSLWKIAERSLGDGHKFNVLVEMNKDRLKSPDDVVAGMKLIVPVP